MQRTEAHITTLSQGLSRAIQRNCPITANTASNTLAPSFLERSPLVGRGKVSHFLESLARPHVLDTALDEGYAAMNQDESREQEASAWINGLIGDGANATR